MLYQELILLLPNILISIFLSCKGLEEIAENPDMINELCRLADPANETLNKFVKYLNLECGLAPSQIFQVLNKLSLNDKAKLILKKRLTILWLKYKSFQVFQIFKNRSKRDRIQAAIDMFDFGSSTSNIEELIKVFDNAIDAQLDANDIAEIKKSLIEGKEEEINSLFHSDQEDQDKNLQYLIQDYKYFPQNSIEKILQRELILAYLAKYPEKKKLPVVEQIQEFSNQLNNIKRLKDTFIANYGVLPTQIANILKKISFDCKQIYQNLCALKQKLFIIDIPKLVRYIKKANEAKQKIENKDVLFVVGITGSGKSTTILKLLGHNLKPSIFKNLRTLAPTQPLPPEHRQFKASPEAVSCTSCINAVPMPDNMYPQHFPQIRRTIAICDTPGFSDTSGVEVDIGNGVSMINALYGSRSVRVIVILADDALLGCKMKGAIDVGKIISNMFQDISRVSDSITVYFNKVAKQDISNIPYFIKSKIASLTKVQQADEKLKTFLEIILKQSQNENNYLFPLQSNYKLLFSNLLNKNSINNVKQNFKYQFAETTRKEILHYITNQKLKIKDYINNCKYSQARLHLKFLEQFKNTLYVNQKVRQAYSEIAKFVEKESHKQFKRFQQFLKEAFNGEDNQKLSANIKEAKKKVEMYESQFYGFDEVTPTSTEQINSLIEQYKIRLMKEYKNIDTFDSNKFIRAIKIFSRELAPELEKNVVDIMGKQINKVLKDVKILIDEKNYSQISQHIKILKSTAELISLISPNHTSLAQLEDLKADLMQQTKDYLKFINENLVKQNSPVTQRTIKTTLQGLSSIETILSLKIIDGSSVLKMTNQCIKNIEKKCRIFIQDLDRLDLSLNSQGQESNIDSNFLKNLSNKKKQIELLMKISNVREVLKDDYEGTKENIGRRLTECVGILSNYINALQSNKSDQIERDINIIKKATENVLKCSQIVDQGQGQNSIIIAESISKEFTKYLNGQITAIKRIGFHLHQIDFQIIQQIQNQYKKNQTYSKMASFNEGIETSVNLLKEEFNKILRAPFASFKEKQISYFKQKGHYQCLRYSLQKIQKFCFYSLSLEQIIVQKAYYYGISQDERQIQSDLQPFLKQIKNDVQEFSQMTEINTQPKYLKQLLRALISINGKTYTCMYLFKKMEFQIPAQIDILKQHLMEIKSIIQSRLSQHNEAENRIGELRSLFNICKFYRTMEDALKIKEQCQKMNFKTLQDQIRKTQCQTTKSDIDRAKSLIERYPPSKMSWKEIQRFYNQFSQLNTPECTRNKETIILSFRNVQLDISHKLKSFNSDISNDPDVIIKNKEKMNEFLDWFKEAIEIQKRLKSMYSNEDKKNIEITSKHLRAVGTNLINIFKSQYESVYKQLNDYNISNIKQAITNYGILEAIINDVFFLQEDQDQNQENKNEIQGMIGFIEAKRTVLINQIEKHNFIEEDTKISIKNIIRLKPLLICLHKGINNEIEDKYLNSSDKFIIDGNFKKFSTNFFRLKDSTSIQVVNSIKENVNSYFNKYFNQFKQQSEVSIEQTCKIQKLILQSIGFLPYELKKSYNQAFKNIKLQIKIQNDDMVHQLSQKITTEPGQLTLYLENSQKAHSNGQASLHLKFIQKLESIYNDKSRKSATITDKITFINEYFITMIRRNKHFLDQDQEMFKKINIKFEEELKRFSNITQAQLSNIKKFMQNPLKAEQQNINAKQSVADVFMAYYLVIQLGNNHQDFKKKFIQYFQNKLIQDLDLYYGKAINQLTDNLTSTDILDNQKVKKIQACVQYFKKASQIIEMIKLELDKIEKNQQIERNQNIDKEILNKYKKIEGHTEALGFYKGQIHHMINQANDFEFYDDIKKNMTIKELEADLQAIETKCEILKLRENFFNEIILGPKDIHYEYNAIASSLIKKFTNLVVDSKNQIEDTYKDYNNEPASKINLLMNDLKIMKEKKMKIIPKEDVELQYQGLPKLIRRKNDNLISKIQDQAKIAKEKVTQTNKKIRVEEQTKNQQILAVNTEVQTKLNAKIQGTTKKYDEKIKNQTDESKKIVHQKEKKTEINSFKIDSNTEKQERVKKIQQKFKKVIDQLKKSLDEPVRELAESLTLYQKAILDINYDNERQVAQLQTALQQIQTAGPKFIELISQKLNNNPSDQKQIGRVLLTNNKTFQNFAIKEMKKLIQGKDINYVLANLQKIIITGREKVTESEKNSLKQHFLTFNQKYQEYKELYRSSPQESTILTIANICRDLGNHLKTNFYQSKNQNKGNKVQLLSGIFALWAIQKAQKYEGEVEYIMQPHPTQIVTLILLLGISHSNESLQNRLAQVGTGQGKSVVLAGLSCYLALCGFKVRCACYSSYLSGRDESNFKELFERLGVENEVKYGTFNQLCEDILNQGGAKFKAGIQKMIFEKPQGWFKQLASKFRGNLATINRDANKLKQNPTILVIDEVDVFFDTNFFGNTYCPGIKLSDKTVSNFLEHAWGEIQKCGDNIDPITLIKSQQFTQMANQYPTLVKLLENQVHGIISGAINYKHDYFIIDKKIVYKDNDAISPNLSYGFKTVFANIYEYKRGNVSRENLNQALYISLVVAEFSYAKLPIYFDNILGVTGTLDVLPQYKKKQLGERYKIKQNYAIPSAFGVNKLRIDKYFVVPSGSFHQTVIAKIDQIQDKRPIIIFFNNARQLNQFSQSPCYEEKMKRTSNLTEEHEPSVRDSRIVRAVNPNSITLMTNSFGRGTDFILLNQSIKDKGGLHVIHAFLSHDESEQIQIKGRTARQSNLGSYDCILNDNWLQELGLTADKIPKQASSDIIHDILFKARQEKVNKLSQITLNLLKQSDQKHQNVVNVFAKQSLSQTDIINYVSKLNVYPETTKLNIKAVLGMDATGSMGGAIRKCCEIIGTSFERAYNILEKAKVKALIEIKIMVYRNYSNTYEDILQGTAFESTTINLRKFLERVGPKGGMGNEAIEVFLQALNKQDKLDLVYLIGDAAPNTVEQVTQRRAIYGQNYWNSNNYLMTNSDKEIQKLIQKKCPIHTFYLGAKDAFNSISKKTGGISSPFNLSSPNCADNLTAFVVQNILELIERKAGKGQLHLVDTYRKIYTPK